MTVGTWRGDFKNWFSTASAANKIVGIGRNFRRPGDAMKAGRRKNRASRALEEAGALAGDNNLGGGLTMAKVKLQYLGSKVHRDADQFEDASLTVEPGDIVEVSEPKAAELQRQGADNWKRLEAANGDMPTASTRALPGRTRSRARRTKGAVVAR